MEYLQFTDFRNNSRKYLEKIQTGESFIIIKRGTPVARIIPFEQNIQGWKRQFPKIKLRQTDKTTTDFISEERNEK